MTRTKPLVLGLALSTLFVAVLMPPEAYPAGRMAVLLGSSFAFLIAMIDRRVSSRYLQAGAAIFALLLAHSLWLSVDAYRSIEFLTMLWSYYCLLGFFLYAGDARLPFAVSLAALSFIVSVYGLYQYFWGFDQLQAYILNSGAGDSAQAPALGIIATGRVFSTLVLPGTLWGFLLAALPVHAILWRRHRLLDAALLTSSALLLMTGYLTRSFGFLAGLFVLVVVWLFLRHRRLLWNRLVPVLVVLAIAGALFYMERRGSIDQANPASLRIKNWVSAWNIFAVHPLGTGLNTYGVVYPQYMQPRANETQYAHNTPLQMMAELGFLSILAAVALLMLVQRERPVALDPARRYLVLALAVWLAHNLIDINVYFPSVGVLGAVLIGILLSRTREIQGPSPHILWKSAISALAAAFISFGAIVLVSSELHHRSGIEYGESPLEALETLRLARWINPLNSILFHDSGQIELELHHKQNDERFLQAATESFMTAVKLSPLQVDPHIGLGLALASSNQLDRALEQLRTAVRLHPESPYARSIARLIERRIDGGVPGATGGEPRPVAPPGE